MLKSLVVTIQVHVLNRDILYSSQAERASSRREVLHTDFLTPLVLKESMLALEKLANVKTVAQGGYPEVRFYFACQKLLLDLNF